MSQYKTATSSHNGSAASHQRDSEVVERAKRRRFSAAEKRRILQEAEACREPGQVGALLRREGIYSSYLTDWRREDETGQLSKQSGQPGGRQPNEQSGEVARLRQENEQHKAQVAQAELIITAQKNLHKP